MRQIRPLRLIFAALLFATSLPTLAAATTIELVNDSNSDETLIRSNTSGIVTPPAPDPLFANDTRVVVSETPGTVDAGAFTYQSCRFNWSVIKVGSLYQFSDGAEPTSDCESQVILQNFITGEYSVRFTVE